MFRVVATTTSCSAKDSSCNNSAKTVTVADTIMQKALGGSIYRVITKAKKILIISLHHATVSVKLKLKKKLSPKELGVINFIVTNPKNYLSNTNVYGVFLPQLQLTYTLKKESVTIKYDFGLRKWGVFNQSDKEIGMFDLSSDNMLRFACQQFPNNAFFNELLMTREPENK